MATQSTASPKLYIGMDIHKKSWSLNMRTDVCEHRSFTTPPDCNVLYEYVAKNFPGHEVLLTYEAGCCGFGAARHFLNCGWEVKVVNPADIPRKDKQTYQKTDKIDCRNLSKQLQAGQLKGIYIPDEKQDLLKSLVRQRVEITKGLRAAKSRIKSLLLYHSIVIPDKYDNANWSKEFIEWLNNIQWSDTSGESCLKSKLKVLDTLTQEHLHIANELRAYCRKHHKQDYYLLKSIPGIGGYLAAVILAEIGDLRRFSNESQFASYIGIIPVIRASGGTEHINGVTPRCRSLLRSYIIESAWIALRLDPEMQAYYRMHSGKNPKSVVVKIARKMLNRMLSVIKNNRPYQINHMIQTIERTKSNQPNTETAENSTVS